MKVLNSSRVIRRMSEYRKKDEVNMLIGRAISAPVSMETLKFQNPEALYKRGKEFQSYMNTKGKEYTEDEAVLSLMVNGIAADAFGSKVNVLPENLVEAIAKEGRIFHAGSFEDNAYLQNIRFDEHECGRFKLTHGSYLKFEVMMYSTPANKEGIMIPRIGTFDHEFAYPCICEKETTWMSVTPNEIFTMEEPIKEAAGKVLTLGCGMGYFAYMASEKDEVEQVTIIEKEPDVIELFTACILPQFAHQEKITIIQADAFDYMQKLEDGQFDFCFADIWVGNNDTEPYLKLKKLCKRFQKMKMSYWIEDSIVATNMSYVRLLIAKELGMEDGLVLDRFQNLVPQEEKVTLDALKDALKDAEITKQEHVDYYMNPENIMRLLG